MHFILKLTFLKIIQFLVSTYKLDVFESYKLSRNRKF